MKLLEFARRLDRVQKSRRFKVIATIVVVALAAVLLGTLLVAANRPGAADSIVAAARASQEARPRGVSYLSLGPVAVVKDLVNSMLFSVASDNVLPVVTPFVIVTALSVIIIWLGLGLSYLGLLIGGMCIAWPLIMLPATRGIGQLILGVVPLTLGFLVLMQLLRAALNGATPTLAIARNLLNEAVRMKISMVFIVLLILFIALIPNMLNTDQLLRYRVQQWLAYGTGIPYVVLALLTVFLSAATVAFEQRDKIIWQTMTKPVASWRYLLGKWVGVMGLNAVLLTITAGGVYMFTEFLRHQPARGEMAYQVLESGEVTLGRADLMTDDRRLLENQVMVARVGVQPEPYAMNEARLTRLVNRAIREEGKTEADRPGLRKQFLEQWQSELTKAVESRVTEVTSSNPEYRPTNADLRRYERDAVAQWQLQYNTIEPGSGREFEFVLTDLYRKWEKVRDRYTVLIDREVARRIKEENVQLPTDPEQAEGIRNAIGARVFTDWQQANRIPAIPELTLRFKINAGTNVPTELYGVSFMVGGQPLDHRQIALKNAQVLSIPIGYIERDGVLRVGIFSDPENIKPITFPPDGLEILYPAGGYELNFLRVFLVMWLKLGFIAAVAIAASTFLSFPVACLVALCVLFAAESASFLNQSLADYYFSRDREGNIDWFAVGIRAIAVPIGKAFKLYSELKPTTNLVDGRLVSWVSLLKAVGVIGLWSLLAWAIGWAVFRQRELALYSGK